MIHTRYGNDVSSTSNGGQWNAKMHDGLRGREDGLFHQLIDFPWLPGNS